MTTEAKGLSPEDAALFERIVPGNTSHINFMDIRVGHGDLGRLLAAARQQGRETGGEPVAASAALKAASDAADSLEECARDLLAQIPRYSPSARAIGGGLIIPKLQAEADRFLAMASGVRTVLSALAAPPPKTPEGWRDALIIAKSTLERVNSELGEAIHVGLRKGADSPQSTIAHRAICDMPDWGAVVDFATEGLDVPRAIRAVDKALAQDEFASDAAPTPEALAHD